MSDGTKLLQSVVEAMRTSAPTWTWVDAAEKQLTIARAASAPRIVHWRLAWARRIARLGCDLDREGVLALEGWAVSDVIESARRLVPSYPGYGHRAHPGATLDVVSLAPSDPRPHLDTLIELAAEHPILEPGFALLDRLIELEPELALRAALACTWPATLNRACMGLEALLDPTDLQRLARHAWPYLERWPDSVGHAGYGIEPRAWLAPHLEPEERERTLRAIETQLAGGADGSQDFESPVVSFIRALARVGELDRAREVLARSQLSDWEHEVALRALEPEDVERRRETIARRLAQRDELEPSTSESLVAARARAVRDVVTLAAQQLGYCLTPSLRAALRPTLERCGVPAHVVDRMNDGRPRIELDEPLEGSFDDQWRDALDTADPTTWPTPTRWVALAEAEVGESLVAAMVHTVATTLD